MISNEHPLGPTHSGSGTHTGTPRTTKRPPESSNDRGSSRKPSDDIGRLLGAVGNQDEQAFNELYGRCSSRVYGLVRKVLLDEEMSAETVQEVFLTIWQGGTARYNPTKGTGLSWLLTIAHRKAVDKVRAEQNHRTRDLRWGLRNRETEYDHVSETVIQNAETDHIKDCLRELSRLQHQAIELAYYAGMTYTDVAAHLNIPTPTAKTRIRDGLKNLRTCVNDET